MKSKITGFFEVIWFVLGGLMLFMAVDLLLESGLQKSWSYFLLSLLAFGMYFLRRRMRIKHRDP